MLPIAYVADRGCLYCILPPVRDIVGTWLVASLGSKLSTLAIRSTLCIPATFLAFRLLSPVHGVLFLAMSFRIWYASFPFLFKNNPSAAASKIT